MEISKGKTYWWMQAANDHASLCDFGMSQFIDDANRIVGFTTTNANVGGTDRFMAPELLEDKPKTTASDMWAAGCLIIQILTDEVPYQRIIAKQAVYLAILRGEHPSTDRNDAISEDLWGCVKSCWSIAPENRPNASETKTYFVSPAIFETRATLESSVWSSDLAAPQLVVTAAERLRNWDWEPAQRMVSSTSRGSTEAAASFATALYSTQQTSSSPPRIPGEAPENVTSKSLIARVFNDAILRVYRGTVDQSMVTTGFPPEVFAHVAEVLHSMGIEIGKEEEYKYRCIRPKKKATASTTRGLPIPSSNAFGLTGTMLRGLLRHSPSSGSAKPPISSPADSDGEWVMPSPVKAGNLSTLSSAALEPIYGDYTVDQQDEVRFSVELTRIDLLEDTYSMDIRFLKGNLRSYKFLYDTLRERADLANF